MSSQVPKKISPLWGLNPRPPRSVFYAQSDVRRPTSAVRSPQSAVRSPQSAVRSPQSAVRSPQSAVRRRQAAVRSPQSAVRRRQAAVHTDCVNRHRRCLFRRCARRRAFITNTRTRTIIMLDLGNSYRAFSLPKH